MEAVKNTVSNLLGHNKEDTTTADHSQHQHTGHHEQRDDQTRGTTAAGTTADSTTTASTTGTSTGTTVHDQITSPADDVTSKSTTADTTGTHSHHDHHSHEGGQVASGAQGHHDHHDQFPEGDKDASGSHGHHEKHHDHHTHDKETGADPALVGESVPKGKLTGTGEPGSHSAFFGLTPDGKKIADTTSGSGAPVAAHGGDEIASGGGKQTTEGDHGSRAPAGGEELKDQFHKADRDAGQTGGQSSLSGEGGGKPGAGATGVKQGTGDI